MYLCAIFSRCHNSRKRIRNAFVGKRVKFHIFERLSLRPRQYRKRYCKKAWQRTMAQTLFLYLARARLSNNARPYVRYYYLLLDWIVYAVAYNSINYTTRRLINNYSTDDRSSGNVLRNLAFFLDSEIMRTVNEIINTSHPCPFNLLGIFEFRIFFFIFFILF